MFVSGHPGHTSRQLTLAELDYLRDQQFPYALQRLYDLEVAISVYSAEDQENARRARDLLFGVQNSRKARNGMFAGLLDPAIMAKKEAGEKAIAGSGRAGRLRPRTFSRPGTTSLTRSESSPRTR